VLPSWGRLAMGRLQSRRCVVGIRPQGGRPTARLLPSMKLSQVREVCVCVCVCVWWWGGGVVRFRDCVHACEWQLISFCAFAHTHRMHTHLHHTLTHMHACMRACQPVASRRHLCKGRRQGVAVHLSRLEHLVSQRQWRPRRRRISQSLSWARCVKLCHCPLRGASMLDCLSHWVQEPLTLR
jgi:hypothetical protein